MHARTMSVKHTGSSAGPGLLVEDLPTVSTGRARSSTFSNTRQRWHFTRYTRLLIVLLLLAIVYIAIFTTPRSRHHYLHLMSSSSDSSAPVHNFIHDVQPPPKLPSRVRVQKPMRPFEKDPKDINPTMPNLVRKALVIASYEGQKLDWLDRLANMSPGWEVYRQIPAKPAKHASPNLGREAGAYLQYIVDNYHNLSDYTIFNHGHDRSWHQPMRLLDKIVTVNWTAVNEEHYINLRCTEIEGCTDDTKYYFDNPKPDDKRWGYKIGKFWSVSMRPQIGRMPPVIGRRCCAQFAVDKAAILHRPLTFYQRLLDPLLNKNLTELKQYWGEELPEDRFATLFEMTWHIIFGKNADHCPSRDYCNKVHFQDCIKCDGEVNGFKDSEGWEKIKCTNSLIDHS